MTTNVDQYTIETTWSTRLTEDIIMNSIKDSIPEDMERIIINTIEELNNNKHIESKEIFTSVFATILKESTNQPIQSVATHIGTTAGYNDDPLKAFIWGLLFLKEARNSKQLVHSELSLILKPLDNENVIKYYFMREQTLFIIL